MSADTPGDRAAFAERLRLQVEARYRGATVSLDPARYALSVRRSGADIVLPLAALYAACERQPARTAALISEFVGSVEARLVPPPAAASVSASRLLWCVRTRRYLDSLARSDELLVDEVAADLVAFIAESLPGQVMRGVPRADLEEARLDATAARQAASANTERRFAGLLQRIASVERVPADGWRLAGDSLYQGSIVMVASVLRAFVERAGGDVLIGLPDRAVAYVIPASMPAAETFGRRMTQEWRESMNPCSRTVLRSDGTGVRAVEQRRRQASLLPWLSD